MELISEGPAQLESQTRANPSLSDFAVKRQGKPGGAHVPLKRAITLCIQEDDLAGVIYYTLSHLGFQISKCQPLMLSTNTFVLLLHEEGRSAFGR
eukprot:5362635-Amphidinium_carterae.1